MTDEMTAPSLSTRLKVYWEGLPLVTKSVFAACVSTFAASLLVGWDNLGAVCLSAEAVVARLQPWRVITAATFHAGLLHLTFNMMAFLPIGAGLERALGSFQIAWLILLLAVAGDSLYIAVAYLASMIGFPWMTTNCAVGLSGVIFGLIPADVRVSGGSHRSVFGLFSVPSVAYPWVLLVLWQLLVPQSSFLGHLSGLAVGQMYVLGMLRWAVPSADAVQRWERGATLTRAVASPAYIANTGSSGIGEAPLPTHGESSSGVSGGGGAIAAAAQRWLRGPWMPYPPALSAQEGFAERRDTGSEGSEAPIGALLGGAPTRLDPKAAAAAAAAARAQQQRTEAQSKRPDGGASSSG